MKFEILFVLKNELLKLARIVLNPIYFFLNLILV